MQTDDSTKPAAGNEPFIMDSVGGMLNAIQRTIAARPETLAVVVGTLVVVEVTVSGAMRFIDTSASVAAIPIMLTVCFLMVYVLLRMWRVGLDHPADKDKLRAAANKLSEPLFGAATIAAVFLSLGAAPLVILFLFGLGLPMAAFVALFVVCTLVAVRVGMALLVLIPMAVLTEDPRAPLFTRALRLSNAARWPLAQLIALILVVVAGIVALAIWLPSQFGLPLWAEDFVVLPLASALQLGPVVFLSPAAYAVARHCAGGYGTSEAHIDFEMMIAPLPEKAAARGSLFGRRD